MCVICQNSSLVGKIIRYTDWLRPQTALTNISVDQRDYPNNVNRLALGHLDSQLTQY